MIPEGASLRQDGEFSGFSVLFEQVGTPEMSAGTDGVGNLASGAFREVFVIDFAGFPEVEVGRFYQLRCFVVQFQ